MVNDMLPIWVISRAILNLKIIIRIIRIKVFLVSSNSRTSWREKLSQKTVCDSLIFIENIMRLNESIYKLTLMTLIASVALRTALIPFTPFIVITRTTNRESTHMTRHKQLTIFLVSNLIATNSTNFWHRLTSWRPLLPYI